VHYRKKGPCKERPFVCNDLLKVFDPNEIIQQITTRRIIYKAKKTEDPFEILENGRALAFLRGQILL
jgi:hypothetical protein